MSTFQFFIQIGKRKFDRNRPMPSIQDGLKGVLSVSRTRSNVWGGCRIGLKKMPNYPLLLKISHEESQTLSLSFQSDSSSDFKTSLYVSCSVFYIFLINMPGRLMVTSEIKSWCRHFDFYSSSLRVTQTVVTDCS